MCCVRYKRLTPSALASALRQVQIAQSFFSLKMATPNLKDEEPMQIEHTTHDDVFGEITDEGPNYRNVHTYLSHCVLR